MSDKKTSNPTKDIKKVKKNKEVIVEENIQKTIQDNITEIKVDKKTKKNKSKEKKEETKDEDSVDIQKNSDEDDDLLDKVNNALKNKNNEEICDDENNEDNEEEVEEDEDQEKLKIKMLKNLKYDFASYEIKYIYETYLKNEGEINLSPSYQREFSWSNDKQDLFIDSVINNYIIPPIILIKLNDRKQYKYECMDGQHRLTVLKHFIESKPINPQDPHYIRYNKIEDNKKNNIFYSKKKRLEHIKDSRYMTEDEKSLFNDKKIIIIKISNYDPNLIDLFSNIKNEMFQRLQKGEKVGGTDILRNFDHPLINYLKKLNLINYKTYTEEGDEEDNNKLYFNRLRNIMTVKTKKISQLLTEYLFFNLKALLVVKNKSLDIGNLLETKIRDDILGGKSTRFNLKENENWEDYVNTLNLFIKEVSDNYDEDTKPVSQYLLLIMLYYYVSDKTIFSKINNNLDKYDKFTDDYFKKQFMMKIDNKIVKNYTGKRLNVLANQVNSI